MKYLITLTIDDADFDLPEETVRKMSRDARDAIKNAADDIDLRKAEVHVTSIAKQVTSWNQIRV